MRIDVSPANDSSGLSLLAASGVEAMVRDDRSHDRQFFDANQAMLFCLAGDDELKVRVLVEEAATPAEEDAMKSRVSGLLDLRSGKLLVCGGFDPRCLADWHKQKQSPSVAVVEVPPGWYRVVVGATLASLNGQAIAAGGLEAWYERQGEDVGPRPDFGWLVMLARLAGDEVTLRDFSLPGEDGWFEVEAGRL